MARSVTKWKPANDASLRRRRTRVLTAAAQNIDLTSREDAQRQRQLRQNWQLMAWTFYDSVPEIGFGLDFRAHSAARMRIFVAALLENGETDDPVAIENPDLGAPELVIEACQNALRDLGNGKVALANVMESLSINISVAGEAFLLGQEDPITGIVTWTIRSVEEIVIYDDKVMLREGPMTNQGFLGLIPLDPELTYVRRMWKPHPRFRLLAQSEMRRLSNTCEDLLILRRIIRATGRSRLAGRGILLIPTELDLPTLNDDNQGQFADDFISKLTDSMITPIRNEGDASAVVPLVIEGAADVIDKVRWIDFVSNFDAQAKETRAELVGVIATGLDMPREVIEGVMDANHWTAYMVSTDTFRSYTEPHIITLVEMLTAAFLRPYFSTCDIPAAMIDQWISRIVIWYDPIELVTPTDLTQTAMNLHDRGVISNRALRRESGFTEEDAPTPDEFLAWLISKQRTWPANLSEAVIHGIDPSLSVPPITVSGTIPGIKPGPGGGVDVGAVPVATPPGGPAPAVPSPSDPANPGASMAADGASAVGAMLLEMFLNERAAAMAAATRPQLTAAADVDGVRVPTPTELRLSRRLVMDDRELRAKLQVAANAAVLRELERAGSRIRQSVSSNKALREKIAMTRNEHVAMVLGKDEVAKTGLTAAALFGNEWESLREQFEQLVTQHQIMALGTAVTIAGLTMDSPQTRKAMVAFAAGATTGWLLLKNALDEIVQHAAYNADVNITTDEAVAALSSGNVVPAGVIRSAVSVAGGSNPANFALTALGNGAAVPLLPEVPTGGIGTGGVINDMLNAAGARASSYEWVHGPSVVPFFDTKKDGIGGHLALDGVLFQTFSDDVLLNTGTFPNKPYFYPGDHDGCLCDAMPQWVGPFTQ